MKPLLDVLGRKMFHLGPVASGHAMKSINNLITAVTFLATAEGLVIGKAYGLDPAVMNDVLNESTGMSWISRTHIPQRILSRRFDDPFKLDLMVKDINIALAARGRAEVEPAAVQSARHAVARNAGSVAKGSSVSELVRALEQSTGVAITSQSFRRAARSTPRRRSMKFVTVLGTAVAAAAGLHGCACGFEEESVAVRLQRVEDHIAIERLLMEYGRALDNRDFAAYSQLFATNGSWSGGIGTFTGARRHQGGDGNGLQGPEAGATTSHELPSAHQRHHRHAGRHGDGVVEMDVLRMSGQHALDGAGRPVRRHVHP